MEKLAFVTTIAPGRSPLDLRLLVASIREFGGELANAPIWICLPEAAGELTDLVQEYFPSFAVGVIPFQADQAARGFPFGVRVQAGAAAEGELRGSAELLAWLDSDTIMLNEPAEFLLPEGKTLGCRPVHHRLLGVPWREALDPFWKLVYDQCQASPDVDDFMVTHAGEKIRPYINAGSFVIRPEAGLLERWWKVFRTQLQNPDFAPYYQKSELYPIFLHQAIFTGVLLAAVEKSERLELSPRVNYPLHLHQEIPPGLRAGSINDLITVRCENLLREPGWQDRLPIREPLLGWLEHQLEIAIHYPGSG